MYTSEVKWLEYKHGVLNPMARINAALQSVVGDLKEIQKFTQTMNSEGIRVTITVEKLPAVAGEA